ncbi:MAG TPA: hypothetical protein VN901_00175, partial [Candidatus Acidoferrales bacterium]|nr:hypothetical protein [Candidatus Acidoferrales bacterium]
AFNPGRFAIIQCDPVGALWMLVRRSTPDMLSVSGKGNALKSGRVLRVAEDHRAVAESPERGIFKGGMGLHLRGRGLPGIYRRRSFGGTAATAFSLRGNSSNRQFAFSAAACAPGCV